MALERDAERASRRAGTLVRGMSARLLLLTLAAVVLVALAIFVPSAAAFRTSWLEQKVDAARLATLAAEASPDFELSDDLAKRLLNEAEVRAVAVKREGRRELILRAEDAPAEPPLRVDLRALGLWTSIAETCMTAVSSEGRYLLIVDAAGMDDVEFIEVLVEESPLKAALWRFTRRVFFVTLLIAAIGGAVIYLALAVMFVRPMRRLADAMARFREEPEDPTRMIRPSARADEIGEAEAALAELQEQVRQALAQKARLAALGEAVAKINHDLRNVLANAQLVSDRLAHSPDPQVRAQGERLVRAIDRGVRLAQEVLEFGKAEERAPAREPIRLRPLLEEAFTDASSAASTPTGFDLRVSDAARVTGDEEFLHRVFLNLMRNAVIATAGQEGRAAPGVIRVDAREEDGFLSVRVADDGPGLPPKAREGLFQPFAGAASKNGTGLGLAIARELARAQGGDVALVETSDKGTVFEVRLPRG